MIWVESDNSYQPSKRDITIYPKNGGPLQRISEIFTSTVPSLRPLNCMPFLTSSWNRRAQLPFQGPPPRLPRPSLKKSPAKAPVTKASVVNTNKRASEELPRITVRRSESIDRELEAMYASPEPADAPSSPLSSPLQQTETDTVDQAETIVADQAETVITDQVPTRKTSKR